MARVLVTRPAPAADRSAARYRAAGHEVHVAPLLAFAGFVAYERVDATNHDFSDVVSGSLIGIASVFAPSFRLPVQIEAVTPATLLDLRAGAVETCAAGDPAVAVLTHDLGVVRHDEDRQVGERAAGWVSRWMGGWTAE